MIETGPSSAVRSFLIEKGAFTRSEAVHSLGPKAASAISSLVIKGQLVSPGRGVYALPGIHDEDPRLVAALERAGSSLYPLERRIAAMTPVERAARADTARRLQADAPRVRLIEWMRIRRVASVPEVREGLGHDAAGRLAQLATQGELVRIATGVYAHPDVDPDGPEVSTLLAARAVSQAAVTAAIDAARAEYKDRQHDPALRGKAVLRVWNPPRLPGDRPVMARVYIDIPGYPPFFGQKSGRKIDGRAGVIAWNSANAGIGPVEAAALARKVFDPVPIWFDELSALVPDGRATVVPLTTRADAHADMDVVDDPAPVSPEMRHMLPCAYVVSDTERLDPASLKHPLPEPVRLLVDHREPQSIITALRRVPNLEVVRTELAVGDYVVEGRIVIERKSADDFDASIGDGAARLMGQAEAMAGTGLHRILLIEGGPYAKRHYVLNRLTSTLSYLQNIHGIHVTPTMNTRHSVYMIVQAVKHHMFGMFSATRTPDPIDKREIAADPSMLARFLLSHLNGVSEERVKALVQHFGSIRAIANADVRSLREVKGIGPKVAEHIAMVLGHEIRV